MYIVLSSEYNIKVVDHKRYEPGNSYIDCDRDFGLIEKKKPLTENVWPTDIECDLVEASNTSFVVRSLKVMMHSKKTCMQKRSLMMA